MTATTSSPTSTATATTTAAPSALVTTTTTAAKLDRATTTIILIDSINNNSKKIHNKTKISAATTPTPTPTLTPTPTSTATATFVEIPKNAASAMTPNGSSNGSGNTVIGDTANEIIEIEQSTIESVSSQQQPRTQKRRSLLNFKSLDFHLKSFYSGLRSKHVHSQSSSLGGGNAGSNVNVSGGTSVETSTPTSTTNGVGTGCRRAATMHNRMPPYLKIEAVDAEESENLLLDYPQSPYSSRRNSSPQDNNRSSSQLLNIDRYGVTRSQATSPSPYFLSPYVTESGNIRRSSTSDITSCKRSGSSSASDSRRPSTSDLLRRARERRGSEARMGRSVSHSGLPRGGRGGHGGGGGRRTSIAF